MKFDLDNDDFADQARRWLGSLSDSDVVSFATVVNLSPGYYPSTLRGLWLEEIASRGLEVQLETPSLQRAASLPVGHALDYDWRFSATTRDRLLAQVEATTTTGDHVAFLGTPTLFAEAVEHLPDRVHWLLDANGAMIASLTSGLGADAHALEVRLGVDPIPDGLHVRVSVLDPPWYPAETFDFLMAAASVTLPAGRVLLSQPTPATRPGVVDDRDVMLKEALELGLEPVNIEDGVLLYQTPHFERMSLVTEMPAIRVENEWRRGDLIVFRRTGTNIPLRASARVSDDQWREVSFGPVRVKLRAAGGGDLRPVADGLDRLITVSRRDPIRSQVGFWTSGNRVRTLVEVDRIARLIGLCENDLVSMTFTQSRTWNHAKAIGVNHRVSDELFEILLLEYQEHVAGGYGVPA